MWVPPTWMTLPLCPGMCICFSTTPRPTYRTSSLHVVRSSRFYMSFNMSDLVIPQTYYNFWKQNKLKFLKFKKQNNFDKKNIEFKKKKKFKKIKLNFWKKKRNLICFWTLTENHPGMWNIASSLCVYSNLNVRDPMYVVGWYCYMCMLSNPDLLLWS